MAENYLVCHLYNCCTTPYSYLAMLKLNDNYYHRKCYFEKEQVPTQTVMQNKMKPPLAQVYFKSMSPKLKVLAGLEPSLRGGGFDWYMPPNDILEGTAVLKPETKAHVNKLSFNGIDLLGEKIVDDHHKAMDAEIIEAILQSDTKWKKTIESSCQEQYEESAIKEAAKITKIIQQSFHEFSSLIMTSLNNVETIIMNAAIKEIERVRDGAHKRMVDKYKTLLKQQATMLYNRYINHLAVEQARLKAEFIEKLEKARIYLGNQLHDINIEKHVAIEKLRHLLESQNLACQIYIALKEREECKKEIDLSKKEHLKNLVHLREQIKMHDFELRLQIQEEKKRQDFNKAWKIKISHVVKKFQMFVEYCLNMMPEHAEFFVNMEKLMLLQLGEASEKPSVESIFEPEPEFHTPVPRPHPFFLFCDKGYKPQLEQSICPKHCTSSASQLPVIVVNKRCIYAACDNFDVYTDKVTQYLHGRRGDDADFEDYHKYQHDVPVKYTSSQQLLELKLESSLMQVLQQELPNTRKMPIECELCRIPCCFDSPPHSSNLRMPDYGSTPASSISSGHKIESRHEELELGRAPKWGSYLDYVLPKKCKCAKTAKKHLSEHMPPYIRIMSKFEEPELPEYEPCSLFTLKKLVKEARGKPSPPPEPKEVESKTRDVGTQYLDQEFETICECFSEKEVVKLFENIIKGVTMFDVETTATRLDTVDGGITPSYLTESTSSFATHRAFSLQNVLDGMPELQEIFRKVNAKCDSTSVSSYPTKATYNSSAGPGLTQKTGRAKS